MKQTQKAMNAGETFYLRLILIFLLFIGVNLGYSQDDQTKGFRQDLIIAEGEEDLFNEAEDYFEDGNYLAALPLYLKLFHRYAGVIEYKYRTGICYLYKTDEKHLSIEYLEEVLKENPKSEDLYYYLGRAYHLNYRFDESIRYLNKASKQEEITEERTKEIKRLIENCKNGKILVEDPLDVKIENIGYPINTRGSEYVPVISADEALLIFTYRGPGCSGGLQNEFGIADPKGRYYEDVYISYKLGNTWLAPEGIGQNINTPDHDASIALSADGQKLYLYRDTKDNSGDIFVSELTGNDWGVPLRLNININSDDWEGSASLSPDEKALYFVSERPGGYGGKDIYKSTKRPDDIWDEAVNLGPAINTPYDDDAPFIHPDGKTLYFSSKGHNSMGGYDIFLSTLQDNDKWSKPENIRYPINTTDDDIYYVVSANGERGYYSSGRMGGYGQQDIYVVHTGESAKKHALILVKGIVTANDEFVEAQIEVANADFDVIAAGEGEIQGTYKSNSATGKYLINLPTGKNYNITYKVEGFSPHLENVNATEIDTFMEIVIDVRLYSDDYVPRLKIVGNLLYSEQPAKPASKLTIRIEGKDKSIFKETVTNKRGYFRFINLPMNENFLISIDVDDPDLILDANVLILGQATYGVEPKEGLLISGIGKDQNEVRTDAKGRFRLENVVAHAPEDFKYSILPGDKAGLDTIDFRDPAIFKEVLAMYGDRSAYDLIFKVQVGAYRYAENFDFDKLTDLGTLGIQLLEDGITRFTMGKFKTLNDAEVMRQKVIDKGSREEPFVIIFYQGRRILFSELIFNRFYAGR